MHALTFKHYFNSSLPWWSNLKTIFYIGYFVFFQVYNHGSESFIHFIINTLFLVIAICIIEITQYGLKLAFRKHNYGKAVLVILGNYVSFALLGYYILHGSQNILANLIWDRQFEASRSSFLHGFNLFFWTFFKYGIIVFLIGEIMLLLKLVQFKKHVNLSVLSTEQVNFIDQLYHVFQGKNECRKTDVGLLPPDKDDINYTVEKLKEGRKLSVKSGSVIYVIDPLKIVFMEVQDQLTTIHLVNGTSQTLKVSLSKLEEWLSPDQFARINDKHIIAFQY